MKARAPLPELERLIFNTRTPEAARRQPAIAAMSQHTLNLLLNVSLAVAAAVIFVSWIRHRTADYGDIERSDISEDLAAADELLEDVINERGRWEAAQRARD
jgi:hypothetical protein